MKRFKGYLNKNGFNIMLIFVVLFSIILSGCGGEDVPPPIIDKEKFKTGTDEVEIQFQENAPPDKLYDNSNFRVIPKVTNKGAYTVNEGILVLNTEREYVSFEGSEDSMLGNSNVYEFKELLGKSFLSPDGSNILPTFDLFAKSLEATSSKHEVGLYATLCYNYETELTTEVCIDPDLYNERGVDKLCKNSPKSFSGQGAPVSITNLELELIPKSDNNYQIQLIIEVENRGNGKPINPNKLKDLCSSSSFLGDDINTVYLEEVVLMGGKYVFKGSNSEENDGTGNLECTNFELSLAKESTTSATRRNLIKCRSPDGSDYVGGNEPVRLSQAYIKLNYGYMLTKGTNVLIENGDY